jgi:hypothetical protein
LVLGSLWAKNLSSKIKSFESRTTGNFDAAGSVTSEQPRRERFWNALGGERYGLFTPGGTRGMVFALVPGECGVTSMAEYRNPQS